MARVDRSDMVQLALLALLTAGLLLGGGWRLVWHWLQFATHAAWFPVAIWRADGPATAATVVSYLVKLALALAPALILIRHARAWRVLGVAYAGLVLFSSVAFVRACPTYAEWGALLALSGVGVALARFRWLRWTVALPLIVLIIIPARRHSPNGPEGLELAARCAANDGERAANVDPRHFAPAYYGVHVFPPDWILLTGETPDEGKFLGLPHAGHGSWWLRRQPDGGVRFQGPSWVTGNIWTSCRLGDEGWIVRAGWLMRVRPPNGNEPESVERMPFHMVGFDAPDTACDPRTGSVFASDLGDGRLVEVSPRTGGQPRRRADAVSGRGGLMSMRRHDDRLVMLDFQDLLVYAPDEARVLHRTPAAIVSSSLALCEADGAAAVPDLAGRLRVFRVGADGGYEFDWGVSLFAPRAAEFSPDCAFIGVTSGDDRHVWIVERSTRRVIKTFRLGPAIRGIAFIGARELAVADACTLTVLRF